MWSIIFLIVFPAIILFNLIRIMIYGKSIFNPNFKAVDERFQQKTGFTSYWNTWYGKLIYYVLLTGFLVFIGLIILFWLF